MFEGKMAWDVATEIRTVVECVLEELRGVVESLERVSGVTETNPFNKMREANYMDL